MTQIFLETSERTIYRIEKNVIELSATIENILEDMGGTTTAEYPIPLPNVTGKIFEKVLDFCKNYLKNQNSIEKPIEKKETLENQNESKKRSASVMEEEKDIIVEESSEYEKTFCKEMDQETLINVLLAANYLDINILLRCFDKMDCHGFKVKIYN